MSRAYSRLAPLLGVAIAWGLATEVRAVGTPANTPVNNQATLSYSVNGVRQTDVASNVSTFRVDTRVDVSVTWQDAGNVPIAAGQTGASVVEFRVTNTGNAPQDFLLDWSNGGGDAFDLAPGDVQVFVESGATPGFQAAEDVAVGIDELAPDDGSGATFATAYLLVANIPGGLNDGDTGAFNLIAQAAEGGAPNVQGAPILTDDRGTPDLPGQVQTVFGDGAGTDAGDGPTDGRHSATGVTAVADAQLAIDKQARVLRDPVSGATNPKAIPGALLQYTITVTNDAAAPVGATLEQVDDALSGATAFDADLTTAAGVPESGAGLGLRLAHTGARTLASPRYFTTAADADGAQHDGAASGGTVSADFAVLLPAEAGYAAGELRPGESVTLTFNVIVQ